MILPTAGKNAEKLAVLVNSSQKYKNAAGTLKATVGQSYTIYFAMEFCVHKCKQIFTWPEIKMSLLCFTGEWFNDYTKEYYLSAKRNEVFTFDSTKNFGDSLGNVAVGK